MTTHQDFPFLQNLWPDISINSVIQKSSCLYALLHSTQNYSTPLLHLISTIKNAPTKTGWSLQVTWNGRTVLYSPPSSMKNVKVLDSMTHTPLWATPVQKTEIMRKQCLEVGFGLAVCWAGKFRLSFLFKSCVLLTMSFDIALTITETFNWLSLLPILLQK